ncbi:MAG: 50S ribosomal protein L32e [Thermoplasmata archaeon]|nr:50S ribosomal protein L32e [Thermoplasmata archaeon]
MADEPETPKESTSKAPAKPRTKKPKAASAPSTESKGKESSEEKKSAPKKEEGPKAPRRPTLDPETKRLLRVRGETSGRRPLFVRTASHRYHRIGRWDSWRRPKGQQSKQRRHYGYRPTVVSIGFRGPKAARGLTPSGFRPVIVRTIAEVEALDAKRDAAIVARAVGTRRRLQLEEAARRRGVHLLNPLFSERAEE